MIRYISSCSPLAWTTPFSGPPDYFVYMTGGTGFKYNWSRHSLCALQLTMIFHPPRSFILNKPNYCNHSNLQFIMREYLLLQQVPNPGRPWYKTTYCTVGYIFYLWTQMQKFSLLHRKSMDCYVTLNKLLIFSSNQSLFKTFHVNCMKFNCSNNL